MVRRLRFSALLGLLALLGAVGSASANITRIVGPQTVAVDNKQLIKFDAAFDSINQVYLVVWGTQLYGPVIGQFLNKDGTPTGAPFVISAGTEQSGWARVVYSQEQQRFLIAYTKIIATGPPTPIHQRIIRLISYTSTGPSFLTNEVIVDTFTYAGNAGGVAYSPGADAFLVAWHKHEPGTAFPRSFVAAISPSGAILSSSQVSDAGDGQSDPNIACNDTGRCLVVGYSWGNYTSTNPNGPWLNTVWARFVDGVGVPVDATSFYLDSAVFEGDPTVAFSPVQNKFLVAFVRDFRSVWGKVVDVNPTLQACAPVAPVQCLGGSAFSIMATADPNEGFGMPSLAYNSTSQTFLLAFGTWTGHAAAQELDGLGALIGSPDVVPKTVTLPQDPYPTHYVIAGADPTNNRFLLLDNQLFTHVRSTAYAAGGSPPPPPPPPPPAPPPGGSDIDGDGTPDSSDQCAGVFAQTSNGCPVAGPSGGDLNGDGLQEVVFVNQNTGQAVAWIMSGTTAVDAWVVWPNVEPGWALVGLSDLTGDGVGDLLWQHVNGAVRLLRWNQALRAPDAVQVNGLQVDDPNWRIVATGDFSGDGKADILWHHQGSGLLFVWFMSANGGQAAIVGGDFIRFGGVPLNIDTWQVVGTGDFDGNGTRDIVWQHPDGNIAAWAMNGPALTGAYWIGDVLPQWRIRAVKHYAGDARDDVLFQNSSTGELFVWRREGNGIVPHGSLAPGAVPPDWVVSGPR
jgi:hypothetical protein